MGLDLSSMIARSSLSGWLMVALLSAGLVRVWMLTRPKLQALEQDGEEKLRAEMWRDIDALKEAKTAMGVRLSAAETQIAQQKIEIGQQRFILNLVITELEIVSPGNPIAKQARVLLDQMQPAAFGTRNRPTDEEAALLDQIDGRTRQ